MTSQRQASYQRHLAGRGYLTYYVVVVLIWGAEAVLTKAFLLDVLTPGAMLLHRCFPGRIGFGCYGWGVSLRGWHTSSTTRDCKVRMWSSPVWQRCWGQ
jgi:hypothetical protein